MLPKVALSRRGGRRGSIIGEKAWGKDRENRTPSCEARKYPLACRFTIIKLDVEG